MSVLASFLGWVPSSTTNHITPATAVQTRTLSLTSQLWRVIQHVFCEAWLSSAADSLLVQIQRHTVGSSDQPVNIVWGEFCALLITDSGPSFLEYPAVDGEVQDNNDVKRMLWPLKARTWDTQYSWMECVAFLSVPIR